MYEAIGRRRSIRYLLPFRPVEPEKIQCMLEAARLASHWGNVASLRALVIERDKASQEVLDALPSPVSGYQAALAPVVIVWYIETGATAEIGDPAARADRRRCGRLRRRQARGGRDAAHPDHGGRQRDPA
ncbi:MAG: nitroreductase family protein [Microthrixaceae bacterium]|nr:nitroreductase family protein [Microthrixaceae bacterium]